MFDQNIINFIFKEGREGRLLSFCLELFNLNSVLVKPAINVEQVFIQEELNGVDITIQISQMGIINIQSLFKTKQPIGQIIDV